MGKKENLNQAFYEMFGVGKNAAAEEAEDELDLEALETQDLAEEPVFRAEAPVPAPAPAPAPAPDVRRMVTYLAPGSIMEGTLRSKEDVEIAGDFKGDIISEGSVTIHSSIQGNITAANLRIVDCTLTGDCRVTERITLNIGSSVTGNISAGELLCSGRIAGDLDVRDNVTLDATASVEGNIATGTMTMAKGALIKGSLEMRAGGQNG